MGQPILVTGAHRSGTTWVGKMLALAPRVGLIHEPFSPITSPGISPARFDRFFQYVCEENEDTYLDSLRRTLRFSYDVPAQLRAVRSPRGLARFAQDFTAFGLNRLRGARPLLKDPIAVFSSEWIASRFDATVIVLVRHPAAFASSLKRLDWTHDFSSFLEQPLLLRDHLGAFEEEIREFVERERDVIDQAILFWRLIYSTVLTFRQRNPTWVYVRHEDLSLDPVRGFASLYERLGLELTGGIRSSIEAHSDSANPSELEKRHDVRLDSRGNVKSWQRRLSAEEIERIRAGVADVAPAFYSDDDW